MKTNKHKQRDIITNYVNSLIDCQDYNLPNTKQSVINIFKDEYNWKIKQVGLINAFIDWLKGLPSCINLPYMYVDIEKVLRDDLKITTCNRITFNNDGTETHSKIFDYEGPQAADLFYYLITCNILNIN